MTDARLRRDVIWNLVPVALLGGVGLGSNFAIFTWWGPESLAVFNLVTTAFFVLAVLGACGVQFSVLRALAEAPDDRERVASVVVGALVPNIVLAAVMTGVFLALRGPFARLHHSEAVAEGMLVAAPGLFCFSINKVLFNVVNGLRRMRAFAVYTSLRYALIAAGVITARLLDVPGSRIAIVWTITECTMLVVLGIEVIATVSLARATRWRMWVRLHLDYGVRGVLSTLAYEINTKLDIWMLGASGIAKELVGVYAIAGALNEGATQLSVVMQNNLNPILARELAAGNPEQVVALARRTRRWFVPSFSAACLAGAAAFPVLLPWLMHDAALHADTLPFAILMIGLAVASPYLPFAQILLMANRPGAHTWLVVTMVTINFVVDLALIPAFGLVGAACGTAIAVASSALLVRVLGRKLVARDL
ncbi:MAG: polysaccharide biosynthesis C-terminal domain-containing protein [Deltaproteobacteria bacterium]